MLKDHIFLYGDSKYKRLELAKYIKEHHRKDAEIIGFDSSLKNYVQECFGIGVHHPKYEKLLLDTRRKLEQNFGYDLFTNTLFDLVRKKTPSVNISDFDGYIIYDGYTHKHIDHNYLKIWVSSSYKNPINLEDKCDILLTSDRPYEEQNFDFFYQDFHKNNNGYFGELGKKSVFVYETNLAGISISSSSKVATDYYGVGKTYFSHIFKSNTDVLCYAIATRDCNNLVLPEPILKAQLQQFFKIAKDQDNLIFYLSDLHEDIKAILSKYFIDIPFNIKIPYQIQKYINN